MDYTFGSNYLLFCLITIFTVVVGIFAPSLFEDGRLEETTDDAMSWFHCRVFGWSIFIGGIGVLFSLLADANGLWLQAFAELALFGFAYFVGLLAFEHDRRVFRARCRAVYERYCQSLEAFFATREQRKHMQKPDLTFMKKVEVYAPGRPEHAIRMRIHFARCLLGFHPPTYELEGMVIRYVRAGGLP